METGFRSDVGHTANYVIKIMACYKEALLVFYIHLTSLV